MMMMMMIHIRKFFFSWTKLNERFASFCFVMNGCFPIILVFHPSHRKMSHEIVWLKVKLFLVCTYFKLFHDSFFCVLYYWFDYCYNNNNNSNDNETWNLNQGIKWIKILNEKKHYFFMKNRKIDSIKWCFFPQKK